MESLENTLIAKVIDSFESVQKPYSGPVKQPLWATRPAGSPQKKARQNMPRYYRGLYYLEIDFAAYRTLFIGFIGTIRDIATNFSDPVSGKMTETQKS